MGSIRPLEIDDLLVSSMDWPVCRFSYSVRLPRKASASLQLSLWLLSGKCPGSCLPVYCFRVHSSVRASEGDYRKRKIRLKLLG